MTKIYDKNLKRCAETKALSTRNKKYFPEFLNLIR